MTRPTPDPSDRVLVLIEEDGPVMSVDDWLAALDDDPPTEVEVNAVQILRDVRTRGER